MAKIFHCFLLFRLSSTNSLLRSVTSLAIDTELKLASGGFEYRMCSPEPQWLHLEYMEKPWNQSDVLRLPNHDEFTACADRVREASKTAVDELSYFAQKWTKEMSHGAPPCNLDEGRALNFGAYNFILR